jgi:hypothetical protein
LPALFWKDAEPDLSILKQAKIEYVRFPKGYSA